jgi:hypothetical protein
LGDEIGVIPLPVDRDGQFNRVGGEGHPGHKNI